jgi:ankyrin repeat protein
MKEKVEQRAKLFHYLKVGDCNALKELLQLPNVDLNDTDKNGNTPLNISTQVGNTEQVNLLISNGVDLNKPNVSFSLSHCSRTKETFLSITPISINSRKFLTFSLKQEPRRK